MAYTVGHEVSVKIGNTTFSGAITAIFGEAPQRRNGRDHRHVTIAAQWKDMAGQTHITEVEFPYWKLTAQGGRR